MSAPTPYGDSARDYLELGWWPIPITGKAYPEPGTTGKAGTVTPAEVETWRTTRAARNVAVRHDDTMALDVDGVDHDGKLGESTLAAKVAKWGPLPATWSSTSRGKSSATRQYFYRVVTGTKLVSDLGKVKVGDFLVDGGVEVIHHDHRYSAVAPSLHPDTGKAYKWYRPDGTPSKRPPHVDDLPDLPAKWVKKLTPKVYTVPTKTAKAGRELVKVADLAVEDVARVERWLGTALAGIAGDLDELTTLARPHGEGYTGPPWDLTVFTKAVRLAELAKAPWSTLSLDDAREVLLKHAPRDDRFTDKNVIEKWESALRTAGELVPLPITPGVADVFTIDLPTANDRSGRIDPAAFFHPKDGLRVERLADALAYDLGLSTDGLIWRYEGGVWSPKDDEVERRAVNLLGDKFRKGQVPSIRSAVTLGRNLPMLTHTPDKWRINTRSGLVDWRTGTLEPHDAAALSTIQLPVIYNPAAECPVFDTWLTEVVDPDTARLIWAVLGYLVMSGNPLHRAILLVGNGRNGKGTLLRVIGKLLGRHNISNLALTDITDGKFELAGLFGKLANVAGDIEARSLTNTAKFKGMTGGDEMLAQHKYGTPFYFTPWAVPIFSANQLWQSSDNTDGYLDRWLVIPFNVKFDHETRGTFDEDKLFSELPGIFAKSLVALRELMARGDFELAGQALDVKRQFELESDVVKVWIHEDEHIVAAEAGNDLLRVPRADAYRRYSMWSETTGHGTLNSSNFYRRLGAMGYLSATVRGTRLVLGLKLNILSAGTFSAASAHYETDGDD